MTERGKTESGRGDLMILSAPSGSGKTTLAYALVERMDGIVFSRSTTTRPRRDDERDGIDYDFVSDEVFDRMVDQGRFLEWAKVHRHRYGTPKAFVDETVGRGIDIILNIDVQGALSVQERRPDCVPIFLLPPNFEELRRRLVSRSGGDLEGTRDRLETGLQEIDAIGRFDYVIVNDVLEDALENLQSILRARRALRERMEPRFRPILDDFHHVRERGFDLED